MEAVFTEQTPTRVKNSKLFTENSPNGKRVQILVEELRDEARFDCETHLIDLESDEQKKDWFLKLNPAGKIPVLIDTSSPEGSVAVMESPAILQYIQENYDVDNAFGFSSTHERSQVAQWLFMWHSCARHHGLTRAFMNEDGPDSSVAQRLRRRILPAYSLIEDHLGGKHRGVTGVPRDYLAGSGRGKYSIADIGAWPHVRSWRSLGFAEGDMRSKFPNLMVWIERIASRPAVRRGISDDYFSSEDNVTLVVRSEE